MFLKESKERHFYFSGHPIFTEGMLVTHLSLNAGILSLTNCVVYDKFLLREQSVLIGVRVDRTRAVSVLYGVV